MAKKSKRTTKVAAKKSTQEKEVLYPKPVVKICAGEKALTADQAKKLLGWEETEGEFLFKDKYGKKIICTNNLGNVPYSFANADTLLQEILRGRWKLNGHNRIIGKYGSILNGQHTLVALVLANQRWELEPDKFSAWDSAPTIETSIMFGVSEESHVVDTLDTCRPRKLSDVLYRRPYFIDLGKADRTRACRLLEYAVKFIWARTGVANANGIRRTHSESIDFLERHPRLVQALEFIFDEEGKQKKLSRFLPQLGKAAGLLYLMGSAKTEPRKYHQSDNPQEDLLNWDLWDQTCDFWALLAGGSKSFDPLKIALGKLIEDEDSTNAAKVAVLIRGWLSFLSEKSPRASDLKLDYYTNQDGIRVLAECPIVGGIDVGDGEYEGEPTPQDPTPQEIDARASEERVKRSAKKKGTTALKKAAKKKVTKKTATKAVSKKTTKAWKWQQSGWLAVPSSDPIHVKIIKLVGKIAIVETLQGFPGCGTTQKINVDRLTRMQPGLKQPVSTG